MKTFAEILDGKVHRVYPAPERPLIASPFELVEVEDWMGIPEVGKTWDGYAFAWPAPPPPPPPKPELAFSLQAIGPDAARALVVGTEATVLFGAGNKVKTTVTVMLSGHPLDGEDGFPSFDHAFRLPIQPVDAFDSPSGPAIQKLLVFTKGKAVIEFEPEQAVAHLITQAMISTRLTEEEMVYLPAPVRIVAVKA